MSGGFEGRGAVVTGAGHLMQLERCDEVTRLMAEFLDDIAERGAPP